MSCHDGVVAADQHYGSTGGNFTARLLSDGWNGAAVGMATLNSAGAADFSNDHPIGFDYAAAEALDDGLFAAAGRFFLSNNNNPTITVADVLTNGVMTCATCHDVHNKDNADNTGGGASLNYLVYSDQAGSSLCLTCHVKGDENK